MIHELTGDTLLIAEMTFVSMMVRGVVACLLVFFLGILVMIRRTRLVEQASAARLEATPIDRVKLPRAVEMYFNSFHPFLEELGFDFVDDYLISGEAAPVYCRFYATEQADTLAEISVCKSDSDRFLRANDTRGLTYVTVLADGASIQTTNRPCDEGDAFPADEVMVQSRPALGPADLYTEHREGVSAYLARVQTVTLCYPQEQAADICLYYHNASSTRSARNPAFIPNG